MAHSVAHSEAGLALALTLGLAMLAAADARRFEFVNRLRERVWVGTQGNSGKEAPRGGGFELPAGGRASLDTAEDWGGRFWARTGCRSKGGAGRGGALRCATGDCGGRRECRGAGGAPPVTLAEFTLTGWGGNDFYDISNVDGFNVPTSIEVVSPQQGGGGGRYWCRAARCTANINGQCPGKLRVNNNGRVVGCKSACLAFNTDQYCCRGAHNKPHTCRSRDWPVDYPAFFKRLCPDAYSYAYDDKKSTFTCRNTAYRIIFG